ncbi:MAG: hypothetical protein AAF557_10025 [Pseudomonadota bacterium]
MNKHTPPYATTFHSRITNGLDVATSLSFASDFLREQTAMPSAQVPLTIGNGRVLAEAVELPFVGKIDDDAQDCENAAFRSVLSHALPSALSAQVCENREAGETSALPPDTILTPLKIGLLAAMGMSSVWVRRKLPVAVMSLGTDLIDPGTKRQRGQSFDTVRPMLMSALNLPWISANDLGIIGDDRRLLRLVLEAAATKNRVILANGINDENDAAALKDTVMDLGGIILVNSVTIAPGQSSFLATVGASLILTMPANSVGAWNVFTVLCNEIIRAAAHLSGEGTHAKDTMFQNAENFSAAL